MPTLKLKYAAIAQQFCSDNSVIKKQFTALINCYNEKGRYYHNANHISSLLLKADKITAEFSYSDDLIFAIFYHDIIYKPLSKTNEEDSANFAISALSKLNFPQKRIEKVAHIIRRTKNHFFREEGESIDLQLMLDLDLMSLGGSPENYDINTKNIRKEYKIVPETLFRAGRKKVLKQFLDAQAIFRTPYFYEKYELQARLNLQHEIKKLS